LANLPFGESHNNSRGNEAHVNFDKNEKKIQEAASQNKQQPALLIELILWGSEGWVGAVINNKLKMIFFCLIIGKFIEKQTKTLFQTNKKDFFPIFPTNS
jgi:hypothetical protein